MNKMCIVVQVSWNFFIFSLFCLLDCMVWKYGIWSDIYICVFDRIVNISGLKLIQYVFQQQTMLLVYKDHIISISSIYRGRCTFCLIFCQFLTFVCGLFGIFTKHMYNKRRITDFLHPLNLWVFGLAIVSRILFKYFFGHSWFLQIVRSYYLFLFYVSIENG